MYLLLLFSTGGWTWRPHKWNNEVGGDSQSHSWGEPSRCVCCYRGHQSADRLWKQNHSVHTVDGIDLCLQPRVSQKPEVHLWRVPETFFGSWRSKTGEEGPKPQA